MPVRKLKSLFALASLCALAALPSRSFADVGLAQRCDATTAATQAAACTGSRTWVHPAAGDTGAYLSYPTAPKDSTTIAWSDANLQFRPWGSIPATYGVMTCTKDLSSVQAPITTADNCAPGNDAVAKVFVAASAVVTAVVATPSTGTGIAKLTWAAPTQNTDGSALTDLAGFIVYQGTVQLAKLPPSTLTYAVAGLAPGTYVFAVTAINATGIESAQAVSSPSTITKQTVPGPPSKVIVTITVSVP